MEALLQWTGVWGWIFLAWQFRGPNTCVTESLSQQLVSYFTIFVTVWTKTVCVTTVPLFAAPPSAGLRSTGMTNSKFFRSRSDIDPSSAQRSRMKATMRGTSTLGEFVTNKPPNVPNKCLSCEAIDFVDKTSSVGSTVPPHQLYRNKKGKRAMKLVGMMMFRRLISFLLVLKLYRGKSNQHKAFDGYCRRLMLSSTLHPSTCYQQVNTCPHATTTFLPH